MPEELNDIQTSVIDRLLELKKQRDVIESRLAKLEEEAESVSTSVVERVRSDYRKQEAALDESAVPLKEEARREYAKLARLLESSDALVTSLQQDVEEVELRHRLGEFGTKEFQAKAQEAAEALSLRKAELEQMEALRARFLAAVDSDEELTIPQLPSKAEVQQTPPPPPEPPPPEPPTPCEAEPEPEAGEAEGSDSPVVPEAPVNEGADQGAEQGVPALPLGAEASGGTVILETPLMKSVGESATAAGTVIIPTILARLVTFVADGQTGETFQLEPLTSIGRTSDNQVRIDQSEVSRSHAEITFTASGYLLRDLGSENGTYVNGERIEQVLLEDGDRIQIGSRRFLFCDG